MAKTFIMSLYKSSRWAKFLFFLIFIIVFVIGFNFTQEKEGFISQNDKFSFLKGPQLYDSFYASQYDIINKRSITNKYEIGEIINKTDATNKSHVLDIGCGTGDDVSEMNDKNINARGLDISPHMISIAKNKYPELTFNVGDATNTMLYSPHAFTHITCLNNTIYYIKNKYMLLKNCYDWLVPGGYLVVHLSDALDFKQKIKVKEVGHGEKATINFDKFNYKTEVSLSDSTKIGTIVETFQDFQKTRKQEHRLFLENSFDTLKMAQNIGFIAHSIIKLKNHGKGENSQKLYILFKPE